jgi:hypothetical protein
LHRSSWNYLEAGRPQGVFKELFAATSQVQYLERLGFATFQREKTATFLEVISQASSGGQRRW